MFTLEAVDKGIPTFGGMMFSFETNKDLTSGTRREDDFTEPDLERHATS